MQTLTVAENTYFFSATKSFMFTGWFLKKPIPLTQATEDSRDPVWHRATFLGSFKHHSVQKAGGELLHHWQPNQSRSLKNARFLSCFSFSFSNCKQKAAGQYRNAADKWINRSMLNWLPSHDGSATQCAVLNMKFRDGIWPGKIHRRLLLHNVYDSLLQNSQDVVSKR